MTTFNPLRGCIGTKRFSNAGDKDGPSVFGRLVGLVKENERLFAAQRLTRERMIEARLYQVSPQNNPILAAAVVQRLRERHSGLLAMLRSNRIEARNLLINLERPEIA